MIRDILEEEKSAWNGVVTHPLQSFEWGEFRKKTGIPVVRKGIFHNEKLIDGFQMTIHKIPHTPWNIGYIPKGTLPNSEMIDAVKQVGNTNNCIFVQFEPNILDGKEEQQKIRSLSLTPSAHPLFTRYTFQLDLTPSEEVLLENMHPKTRYNIRVGQKHGVTIKEQASQDDFETYWHLMEETTKRQRFHAHTKRYHELMWETLKKRSEDGLEAHLFIATYKPPQEDKPVPLVAWILFTFRDSLYYPYGASTNVYRNVMASNVMMWEAIRFGKAKKLKIFDMWGSLGEQPDVNDPWYGFHRLKQGYNPKLVTFVGSFDLVLSPIHYEGYKLADKLRSKLLF